MEKIDHNGPGFEYLVHYRRLDIASTAPNSNPVTDWRQGQYVVTGQETFREYEIYVTTRNNIGPSPVSAIKRFIGYSGEGSEYHVEQWLTQLGGDHCVECCHSVGQCYSVGQCHRVRAVSHSWGRGGSWCWMLS